jgi:hypothetical protein
MRLPVKNQLPGNGQALSLFPLCSHKAAGVMEQYLLVANTPIQFKCNKN